MNKYLITTSLLKFNLALQPSSLKYVFQRKSKVCNFFIGLKSKLLDFNPISQQQGSDQYVIGNSQVHFLDTSEIGYFVSGVLQHFFLTDFEP